MWKLLGKFQEIGKRNRCTRIINEIQTIEEKAFYTNFSLESVYIDNALDNFEIQRASFANCYNLLHHTNLDSHEIIKNHPEDIKSKQALEKYVDHLARGLSIVVNVLDPDIIVLGGGMSNVDYIYESINVELKKYVFSDYCQTWHLGGFGGMENTPTAHADDLPTILGFFKNDPKSRSVNISFSGWILPQTV